MRPRIAVLFDRLGPYHCARLRAAGQVLAITGVEVFGQTSTYAWDRVEANGSFARVTLFPEQDSTLVPSAELRRVLAHALGGLNPDAVVIHGWSEPSALAALDWCRRHRVPAVVMSESAAWDEPRKAAKEAVKQRILSLFSAALVGGALHRDYLLQLGLPREAIFTGYDAVDNDYFAEKAEALKAERPKAETRKKHGLPERYFLASARFVEKKNLPRLVEAYARYRSSARHRLPEAAVWELVLLGDGALRAELEHRSASLGVRGHVLMPGFKQYAELPAYYGLASAFIHPSSTEQWGLVVNEAMASGLPVLVSNRCGCAPDLVQDGVNGFSFDPYSLEEMAHLMTRVSSAGPATLSALGGASRRIISDWGPERFAAGLKAAVEQALAVGAKAGTLFEQWLLRALAAR